MSPTIWDILEIERGSSHEDIRRAYAKKLRVTNPEDDPENFMALRDAYEQALAWVDYSFYDTYDYETDQDDDADDDEGQDQEQNYVIADQHRSENFEAEPKTQADISTVATQFESLRTNLVDALAANEHHDENRITTCFNAVISSPEMGNIAVHDETESWLAYLIIEQLPQSDVIIEASIAYFGWSRDASYVQRPYHIEAVLRRVDEWDYIAAILKSDHPLHGAWQALSSSKKPNWQKRISAFSPRLSLHILQLIQISNYQMPGLRHHLNADSITWWQDYFAKPSYTLSMLMLAPLGLIISTIAIVLTGNKYFTLSFAGLGSVAWLWVPLSLLSLASPYLYLRFVQGSKMRWEDDPDTGPGNWFWVAWIGAVFLFAVCATILPNHVLAMWGAFIIGFGLCVYISAANQPVLSDKPLWSHWRKLLVVPFFLRILSGIGVDVLGGYRQAIWYCTALLLAFAYWRGREQMSYNMKKWVPRWRLPIILLISLAWPALNIWLHKSSSPIDYFYTVSLAILLSAILLMVLDLSEDNGAGKLYIYSGYLALIVAYFIIVPPTSQTKPMIPQSTIFDIGRLPRAKEIPPILVKLPPTIICPQRPKNDKPGVYQPAIACQSNLWLRSEDYPVDPANRILEGTSGFMLQVDNKGKVTSCKIISPSGEPLLDSATCTVMKRRARFVPARDEKAKPVKSRYQSRIVWETKRPEEILIPKSSN